MAMNREYGQGRPQPWEWERRSITISAMARMTEAQMEGYHCTGEKRPVGFHHLLLHSVQATNKVNCKMLNVLTVLSDVCSLSI